MKIIKEGKLPENREHHAKCRSCSTEFAFQEKEGHYESDRDGGFFRLKCPFCGAETFGYSKKGGLHD